MATNDPLGLFGEGNANDPLGLDPLGLFQKQEKSYMDRVINEALPAVANMGVDIVQSVPAGIMGLGDAVGGLVRGKGTDALLSGAETFQEAMQSMKRDGLPRFEGREVEDAEKALGEMTEKAVGYIGDIAEEPVPFHMGPSEANSPAARTIGEAATNFLPIPGASAFSRIPKVGSLARAEARAQQAEAQKVLDKGMAGDAYADADIALANEWRAIDESLKELDNVMIQYGKNLQAPHLGLGGKVARHEDQVGKRESGKYSSQMAMDEDLRLQAIENRKFVDDAHAKALEPGVDHLEQYGPTYKGTTQEHAPDLVRPFQVEQLRKGVISEGEATQIYLKPKFERTAEDRLKLAEYEESLKGPRLDSIGNQLDQVEMDRDGKYIDFPYREGGYTLDKNNPKTWKIQSIDRRDTHSGKPQHNVVDVDGQAIDAFNTKREAQEYLRNARRNYKPEELDRNGNPIDFPYMEGGSQKKNIGQNLSPETEKWITDFSENPQVKKFLQEWDSSSIPFDVLKRSYDLYYYRELTKRLHQSENDGRFRVSKTAQKIADQIARDTVTEDFSRMLSEQGKQLLDRDGKPIKFPYKEGGYVFRDFKKDLEAKGIKVAPAVMRRMWDAQNATKQEPAKVQAHPQEQNIKTIKNIPGLSDIQRKYVDTRSFEEMLPDAQKAEDISFLSKHIINKMIQGKFTASDHPLMAWTSSQIHWIKNNALLNANRKLHGKNRKFPDQGTYNYVWRQLNSKERMQVNEVAWAFNNEPKRVTVADLQKKAMELHGVQLSQKQVQAYQDRVRVNHEVLADMNKVLKAAGKEEIPALPNYWSPNVFDGPFLTKFVDPKTGETIRVESSYFKPNQRKLQQAFPEHRVEIIERGVKKDMDFDQLEWILRQLHKQERDKASKAIAEGLRRQGFRRHGLKRHIGTGGAGSGKGRRALDEYEETSEKYIRGAYEYISNRELDTLFNKILDEKSIDNSPRAKAFSLEAIDSARGGANAAMEALSGVLGEIFRGTVQVGTMGAVRLPQRALRDVIRHSNKVMTTLLLGFYHPIHITAQLLQAPMYAPPQLLAMAARTGKNSVEVSVAAAKALASSLKEYSKWDDSADAKKLREIGALDPTFRYDWSTYASDADPRYESTLRDHLTGMSALSGLESHAVRRPAALMFLHMLRELGYEKIAKSPDEIYFTAKEMADQYMVSTKWYEKPHMFSRTGVIGTTTSPLQSFATTWAGMLREYSKLSAEGLLEGNVAKSLPLAAFMAGNLLTSGVLGLVGIKEWDAIATWLNNTFGYNIPTGSEFVMSNVKSTKLRFGLLSDAIGSHVGAVFNAPTLAGSIGAGVQFMGNAANFATTMGSEALHQMGVKSTGPTSVEKRDALKGVSPRFSPVPGLNWGDIEKRYTPEGAPYQDLAGNAGPITRGEDEWMARRFSTYTNEEVEEKTANWTMKRKGAERSKRLSTQIEKVVDTMLVNPDRTGEALDVALEKLADDGYTGNDIKNALKRELLAKLIESDDRMFKGNATSRKAFLLQILKELE